MRLLFLALAAVGVSTFPLAARGGEGEVQVYHRVAVDSLTLRRGPEKGAAVVTQLSFDARVTPTGSSSSHEDEIAMRLGPAGDAVVREPAPWLEVKSPDGQTGWVYAGGLSPAELHGPRGANRVAIVGFAPDKKVGYYVLANDSYACDGAGGTFVVLDLAENRVLDSHTLSCAHGLPFWVSEYPAIDKLSRKHGLRRAWKARLVPVPRRPGVAIRLAIVVEQRAPRPPATTVGPVFGADNSGDALPNVDDEHFLLGRIHAPFPDTSVLLFVEPPPAGEGEGGVTLMGVPGTPL